MCIPALPAPPPSARPPARSLPTSPPPSLHHCTAPLQTLGDPYDPFSFVASWRVSRSYEYFALAGMGAGSGVNKTKLDGLITESLGEQGDTFLQGLYTRILTAVNDDAVFAPLTYMTTRAVVRPEVSRFAFGQQQVSWVLMPRGGQWVARA